MKNVKPASAGLAQLKLCEGEQAVEKVSYN